MPCAKSFFHRLNVCNLSNYIFHIFTLLTWKSLKYVSIAHLEKCTFQREMSCVEDIISSLDLKYYFYRNTQIWNPRMQRCGSCLVYYGSTEWILLLLFLFLSVMLGTVDLHREFSSVLMDFSFGFCELKTFELILARHLSLLPLPWSWKIYEKKP